MKNLDQESSRRTRDRKDSRNRWELKSSELTHCLEDEVELGRIIGRFLGSKKVEIRSKDS